MHANSVSSLTYGMFVIVAMLMLINPSAVSSAHIGRNVADGETPVTDFRGVPSVMCNHSSSVNLIWMTQPINATIFGIKIFKDENQIYGFSFINPEQSGALSEFQGRLAHNVYHQNNATVFQLTLTGPQYSDTGVYLALLYGSGYDGPMEARLTLTYEDAKQSLTSNHTAGDSKKEAGNNIIVPIFLAILIAVILVIAGPIIVNKWKKRKGGKHQSRHDSKETISLQKPWEDEEKSKCEWKFLCYTSGPTDDRKSEDFGDKEDADDGR